MQWIRLISEGRITSCSTCNGKGRVRVQQGFFVVERECHSCNGEGQIITNPCKNCHGNGVQNKKKTLSVNIPSGVDNGTRIRLSGEGEAGSRGGKMEIYIYLFKLGYIIFYPRGKDVYCQVPLDMASAALVEMLKALLLMVEE